MTHRTRPHRTLRRSLQAGCLLIALSACATTAPARRNVDLLIVGGTVYDGESVEPQRLDVAIRGDRIVAVGPALERRYRATRRIDADGQVVAPGFIDAHAHPATYVRADDPGTRRNAPWLYQGVTTLMIGVDGGGSPDVQAEREWFARHGVGTNLAPYVGFGPVRRSVLGEADRAPDAAELEAMRALVDKAMCEGAFGFSTGLFYAPQSFSRTAEVVALAREAGRHGGIYDTHQRDESSYSLGLLDSTREAIEIGRRAGLPVHIAHIKALGVDVHGEAAELVSIVESARAEGIRVTADQYPWLASGTNLKSALLPRWALDGGRPAMLARLRDPALRARIVAEMADNLRRRGGAGSLLLTAAGHPWTGQRLDAVARGWGIDPIAAALRIVEGDERPPGVRSAGSVASFNMDEDDIRLLMRQPWVITSSDGSDGHPRQYATFPKKYDTYVRQQKVLTLGEFIHRSTGLSARTLGLEQRGVLRPGHFADVVVFDPDTYAPRADYLRPREPSRGVVHLLVNGQPAIADGELGDVLAGRLLAHTSTAGGCR
ncbi:N-acyl-D-amino-acid deacylase family protein [Marilutibacter maris]|uniref:Amidohydrolase n=1 Tax=Marilutibacter maris TaxID=1605891 RepID=A0A2U9T988_9GAMM|nr:amidohydrolase family protein [Lysobacter maris]AWV08142.1 amidohydrolase [Lysobacter maris]